MPALALRKCSEFEIGYESGEATDARALGIGSDGLKPMIVLKKLSSLVENYCQIGAVSPLIARDFDG
jgi:hypothetical protein